MTMRRDDRLDKEERELAAQLARIAPHGEPSADLDARILAMAERGLAGVEPVSAQRQPPRRWPVWLGLAASLTVVAGLAWRLQPALYPRETISYEAVAPVAADTDPNGQRQPIDYVESAAADAAMPPPPPPTEPIPEPRAARAMQPVAAAPAAVAMAAPDPPPAPPQPAAAPTNAAVQADAAAAKTMAADRVMAQEAPRRPAPVAADAAAAAPAPAATYSRALPAPASVVQAAEATTVEPAPPVGKDRAGFDARPPITADTPDVQRSWLARIRELRDAGDVEGARQSLAAFAKRNPKAEIPADLKPLLTAASPPSTSP